MELHWKQEEITYDGLTVHYARSYSAGQPPLILAHGYSDNGMCWKLAAQALAVEYDVILPDARGHGLSSRIQPNTTLDLAQDLAGFIYAMGLERPIVGGHSMGASTAAEMAARFPETVSALILEDPGWRDDLTDTAKRSERRGSDYWNEWVSKYHTPPVDEVMARGAAENPTWDPVEFIAWAESKKQLDPNFATARNVLPPTDWMETARAIQVPTLLITADPEKGAIVTPEVAAVAAEANPLIQVVRLEGAGHNIRREAFDEFMEAVVDFLRELQQG
jgi:pimeloyl-ACP methyl ester carboxylesterase